MSENQMIGEIIKPLDKWDGSAVKNHLDDAVKFFFTHTNQYKENFILIDIRLGISLVAVGVAVFALIWDYLNPFPTSRPILMICVCAYFVFMIILTIYTTMIEKGIFLKAKHGNKSITVSSYMKRFDDQYQLLIELKTNKNGGQPCESKLEGSIGKWVDDEGYFLERKFEDDLKRLYSRMLNKKTN
ncbi:signal peptidase complex subunit 2-like protein [Euroglyphus maynei]|uniref:Signal peptidase complex subunit 2 n=1 Tax=Euroglyphus maynei TaxID=6958 RepID=A0A1Y3BGW6_EURMA|nr:signal peptidase complex subunit 2-like protein [Euroglyphus maynei]